MKDFTIPHASNLIFKQILNSINYNKVINLEILIKDPNELNILTQSLYNFIDIYDKNLHVLK